jgi:hypothetical protein
VDRLKRHVDKSQGGVSRGSELGGTHGPVSEKRESADTFAAQDHMYSTVQYTERPCCLPTSSSSNPSSAPDALHHQRLWQWQHSSPVYRRCLASRAPRIASSNTSPRARSSRSFSPTPTTSLFSSIDPTALSSAAAMNTSWNNFLPPALSSYLHITFAPTGKCNSLVQSPGACLLPVSPAPTLSPLWLPSLRTTNRTRTRQLESMLRSFSLKVRHSHLIPL